MRKLIIIAIIILGIIVYNQVKTPDEIKVTQDMAELCTMSGDVECD